jgi:hypothetical protein
MGIGGRVGCRKWQHAVELCDETCSELSLDLMSGKIFLIRRLRLIALLAMVGVMASVPRAAEEQPGDGSQEATLNMQLIKTGLFLISGDGANSLLRLSPYGEILVNGKRSGNYTALMSQVRTISRITDMPVQVVIITNHNEDRSGQLEILGGWRADHRPGKRGEPLGR